uniref:MRG domain-containing protein n=1 Tax=Caenorhabditis tropicalis TaxID=1561998 RepID=A0A1I7T3M6_9PELO
MNVLSNLYFIFYTREKFPLLTLPDVARIHVIRLMDVTEQFNEELPLVENTISVLKRLQTAFSCKETGVKFTDRTPSVVRNVLNALNDFVFVSLGRCNPTAETLNIIMKKYKRIREISIYSSQMPLDYSHPNKKKVLEDEAENQEEIRQLDEELTQNGVYYVEGIAHIGF